MRQFQARIKSYFISWLFWHYHSRVKPGIDATLRMVLVRTLIHSIKWVLKLTGGGMIFSGIEIYARVPFPSLQHRNENINDRASLLSRDAQKSFSICQTEFGARSEMHHKMALSCPRFLLP